MTGIYRDSIGSGLFHFQCAWVRRWMCRLLCETAKMCRMSVCVYVREPICALERVCRCAHVCAIVYIARMR